MMKTMLPMLGALVFALVLMTVVGASAQGQDLRSIRPETRVGVVSEDVVREKLKAYGFTNVRSLKRVGDRWEVQADLDARPRELEMDGRTGFLREKGSMIHVAPGVSARELMIKPKPELQRPDPIPPPR